MFKNSNILIFGGTGSWGNELTIQLLKQKPKKIKIYSRNEFLQVGMERKFNNNNTLEFLIGDVRDEARVLEACEGIDYIFLLSALKHVPICEEYPEEAIKTNINGVLNVIKAAIKNKVKKVIDVSTDKAVVPINLYGMSKAIGEKLILNADKKSKDTRFVVIRGGNALGSNGSVVPHFINQIDKYNKVELTDKRMTRYFLTLPEAVSLLFIAAKSKISGGIFVMKMPSCKIIDLTKLLIYFKGKEDTKIEVIGMRSGEKIHEVLVSSYESFNTYIYNNMYYLIHERKQNLPKVDFEEFTSNTKLMNDTEIKSLLARGGFIHPCGKNNK